MKWFWWIVIWSLLLFITNGRIAHGQACSIDQGLQCAGNFQGAIAGPQPGAVCARNTVSGMVPFSAMFSGGYQDFYTAGNGSIVWGSYTAPNSPQMMSSNGSCYLACSSGMPVSLLGFSCPSASSSTAVPNAGFDLPVTSLTGSLLGESPYTQDGLPVCQVYSVAGIPVTLCAAGYGPEVLGAEMAGPNHCTDVIVQLPPPRCACGDVPGCGANNTYNACQPTTTSLSYVVWNLCGPDSTCLCEYSVTDYYYCGNYAGSLWTLIDQECYLL